MNAILGGNSGNSYFPKDEYIMLHNHEWVQNSARQTDGLSQNKELTAAAAKSLQSCPTLCDPIDGSPPGSPVPGILQARGLEWGAIAFSGVHC